ncbi:hypothetical protein ACFL6K_00030 [Candidatus Latescibacterota bacterium]
MKRLFFFVSIIVLTVTSGCLFNEDDKKEDQDDVAGNEITNTMAAKYYPLKVGATWIYEATVSRTTMNDTTYTDTYEITDTITYNEISYFTEIRDIGGYGEFLIYFRTAGNILYGVDFNNDSEEKTYLNFNLSLGDSWTPSVSLLEETFDGIVDVEVAAGTFPNCIKFLSESVAIEKDILVKNVIKEYYATGVGRVKSIFIKTDADENVLFSEITELKSYEIPE